MFERLLFSLTSEGKRTVLEQAPVKNENNMFYWAELYVGSEREPQLAFIDTGSPKLVLLDIRYNKWPDGGCCTYLNGFDPSASTSFVNSTTPDWAFYADGQYRIGFKGYDTVSLDTFDEFVVDNFNFLLSSR